MGTKELSDILDNVINKINLNEQVSNPATTALTDFKVASSKQDTVDIQSYIDMTIAPLQRQISRLSSTITQTPSNQFVNKVSVSLIDSGENEVSEAVRLEEFLIELQTFVVMDYRLIPMASKGYRLEIFDIEWNIESGESIVKIANKHGFRATVSIAIKK